MKQESYLFVSREKPVYSYENALAIIRHQNRHIDEMLNLDMSKFKQEFNTRNPIYWYNRFGAMVDRVFELYDASDFARSGRDAEQMAMMLQPTTSTWELSPRRRY